jgi:alkylation response protein AidB-like acyl-CoA dehydrogenase
LAVLTDEQKLLSEAAAAWARERSPVSSLRKLRSSSVGFDPVIFAEMSEMGWAAVLVPEEFGGVDFGFASMGILLEQIGRTLTPSPLVTSCVAAASGIRKAGSAAQKQRWLPLIASGKAVVTLAIDEGPRHDPSRIRLQAARQGSGFILSGVKRPVPNGMAADAVIVAARTLGELGAREGVTLFLIPTDAAGLGRSELREIERRGAAVYSLDGVRATDADVLGAVDAGAETLDYILDCARAALAAEMLGGAEAAFDITLAYLKTRVQFGRLIGEFQALQHRAADLHGELLLTRSAVEAALAALDAHAVDTSELVSIAKALAGDTFRRVAAEMVQMHGGIGMTDEHDAGLYLKRARICDMSFGGASFHRERYAALVGC